MAKRNLLVAEVALYGTHAVGAGWLARIDPEAVAEHCRAMGARPPADAPALLGDGEPKAGRTFTEAVWLACEAVRRALPAGSCERYAVRVFEPRGRFMADTSLLRPGCFGDLKWSAAPVYEISAEAIEAAAEKA